MALSNHLHRLALAGSIVAGISSSAETFPDRNTCDTECAGYFSPQEEEDLALSAARLQGERAAYLVEITASLLWLDYYLQDHLLYTTQKEE